MSKSITVLCFIGLLTIGICQKTDTCPSGWNEFDGRCYKYVATTMTWADAESYCVSVGANLVAIHSEGQFRYVKELIASFGATGLNTWIGLSDLYKEGEWFWTDGSRVSFTKWASGQPDHTNWGSRGIEHCIGTYFAYDASWNDFLCDERFSFTCVTRAGN